MLTRLHHRLVAVAVILLLAAACDRSAEETPAPAPQAAPAGEASAGAPAETGADDPTAEPPAAAPAPGPAPPAAGAAPPPAGAVLAAQETNWPGIVAEVTEFRRKGSTLTARVRFNNQGTDAAEPNVIYGEVYVMDLAAGRKYEVLRDEQGRYIAALRSGWNDRWYQKIEPGNSMTIWMKLPAPPTEVREVTLQVPGVPPFEDLAIQEG